MEPGGRGTPGSARGTSAVRLVARTRVTKAPISLFRLILGLFRRGTVGACWLHEVMFEEPGPEPQGKPAGDPDGPGDASSRAFIGPRVGWWHVGVSAGDRNDLLAWCPADPYLDTTPDVDLGTADFLVEELGRHQSDVNRAEAGRMAALLQAHRAVLAQATELGQSRTENGVVMRAFVLQVALSLQIAERTATSWLYVAQDLREHFPQTWLRFQDGVTSWRGMRIVDQQAEGLDPEYRTAYDTAAADLIGRVPLPRLKERLHAVRERLQADTATARHAAAVKRRRVEVEAMPEGMAALTLIAPAPEVLAIHAGLRDGAVAAHGLDGEDRGIGQLMTDIALDLLTEGTKHPTCAGCSGGPGRKSDHQSSESPQSGARVPSRKGIVPQVSVLVPALTLLGHADVPVTLHGYEPIDLDTARRLCGAAPSSTRNLTHPVTGSRLDVDATTYTPPADLRRYLTTRDGTCRAPGCNRPAIDCDPDHVQPWTDGGSTTAANLAHLCRRHHQVKGSTWWDVLMNPDGDQTWASAWGTTYVTRPADQPEPTPAPPEVITPPTQW